MSHVTWVPLRGLTSLAVESDFTLVVVEHNMIVGRHRDVAIIARRWGYTRLINGLITQPCRLEIV
jgi:hypothetical protein